MKLRSSDGSIQVFCFGKAMYHSNVYRGNTVDGYYFHQQNNDISIKAKQRPRFVFVVALKRRCFEVFLKFSYKEEWTVSLICKFLILLGWKWRSQSFWGFKMTIFGMITVSLDVRVDLSLSVLAAIWVRLKMPFWFSCHSDSTDLVYILKIKNYAAIN